MPHKFGPKHNVLVRMGPDIPGEWYGDPQIVQAPSVFSYTWGNRGLEGRED